MALTERRARGVKVDVDAKVRRKSLLADLRSAPPSEAERLSEPARLIRKDRRR
jgi:hypothetical protein